MKEIDDALLNEYLDGTLPEERQQEVEAFLAQSPEGQARLAEWQSLFATFAEVDELPLQTDLSAPVLAAIRADEVVQTTSWGLRLLPIVQIIAVVILLGLFWATLLDWLQNGRASLNDLIPTVQIPDVLPWELMENWLTAVWQNARTFSLPIDLATSQWLLLVGIALVIWLLGNRLLFTNINLNGGSHG
jgi:hypothetical protein